MSASAPKKPVNRKLLYMGMVGVGLVGALALVAVTQNDPRKKQQEEAEQKHIEQINRLPTGSEDDARDQLAKAQAEAEQRAKDEAERKKREQQAFETFASGGGAPGAIAPTTGGMPQFDPDLLRQLDQAQQEVGARPSVPAMTGGVVQPSGASQGAMGGGAGASSIGITYENYDKSKPNLTASHLTGDLFESDGNGGGQGGSGSSGATGSSGGSSSSDPGVYETIKPQGAPSARVINQGVMIPAVLMSRIDTRNAGPIAAVVSRTVYDSKTHRIPLIPQGSRLVGSYQTSVAPGVDRIGVSFERLILPDGRAFVLPAFPTSGLDGTIGVAGKYHSNLLRSIGPAFVVAVLGEATDRQIRKELPEQGATTGGGVTAPVYQSPDVLQQTVPKMSEAVNERYAGAKPYFTAAPGQEVRVILVQDLEIPTGGAR